MDKDWFTVKEYAAKHGLAISTAKGHLYAMEKAGAVERVRRREIRTWRHTKWEARPVVNYFRMK